MSTIKNETAGKSFRPIILVEFIKLHDFELTKHIKKVVIKKCSYCVCKLKKRILYIGIKTLLY